MTFVKHTKSDKWISSLMMGGNSLIHWVCLNSTITCNVVLQHCVLKCVKLLYCQLRTNMNKKH